jgi:hypothetical protein
VLSFNHVISIVILTVLGSAAACSDSTFQQPVTDKPEFKQVESKTMSTIGSRRRRLPPELPPITVDGVVYKELRQGNTLGLEQKSGYLVASDQQSNEILWYVQVYPIHYIEGKETDVQEVFFIRMELLPSKTEIFIENELDKQFIVNLLDHTVAEK